MTGAVPRPVLSPVPSETAMHGGDAPLFTLDLRHSEIMRAILANILATGDAIGPNRHGRTILAVAVDGWLLDALAAFDAEQEGLEEEEPARTAHLAPVGWRHIGFFPTKVRIAT
jgi:hypothetical protein